MISASSEHCGNSSESFSSAPGWRPTSSSLAPSGVCRRKSPRCCTRSPAKGLANVEQHARATAVVLSLRFEPDTLALTVQDDGVGAPSLVLSTLAESATRFGLRGLRDLVHSLGGTFTTGPGDDGGFVVRAVVPLRD